VRAADGVPAALVHATAGHDEVVVADVAPPAHVLVVVLHRAQVRALLKDAVAGGAVVGGVISKDDIAIALGYSPTVYDFRRLEVIIRRLRNKAKLVLGIEIPLKTAHRRGYAFTDNIKVLDF
jgi:hypothetical protein